MTMQPDELKALRKAAGFSQVELGDAIGMSRETIGAMERQQAPIELRTALAVRYVTERRETVSQRTAAAITGQGEAATMNVEAIFAAMKPLLDRDYVRRDA